MPKTPDLTQPRFRPFDASLLDGDPPSAETMGRAIENVIRDRVAFGGWMYEPVILTCTECGREHQTSVAVPKGSRRVGLPMMWIDCACGFQGTPRAAYADEAGGR